MRDPSCVNVDEQSAGSSLAVRTEVRCHLAVAHLQVLTSMFGRASDYCPSVYAACQLLSALIHCSQGKLEEARFPAISALRSDASISMAHLLLSKILLVERRTEESMTELALELPCPELYVYLKFQEGKIRMARKEYSAAKQASLTAMHVNPADASCGKVVGILEKRMRNK